MTLTNYQEFPVRIEMEIRKIIGDGSGGVGNGSTGTDIALANLKGLSADWVRFPGMSPTIVDDLAFDADRGRRILSGVDVLAPGTLFYEDREGNQASCDINAFQGPFQAPFNPGSLSPTVWLQADAEVYKDAGVTLASNGDTVEEWHDQSGNGNDVTQTTGGNKPTYNTNVQNSLPSVEITGGAEEILASAGLIGGQMTLFIAWRPDNLNIANNTRLANQGGYASHPGTNWYIDGTADRRWNFVYTSAANPFGVITGNSTQHDAYFVDNGHVLTCYKSTVARLRQDGVQATDSAAIGDGGKGGTFRLRHHSGTAGSIHFFEVIGYDKLLTDSHITDVEEWLQDKWATEALP